MLWLRYGFGKVGSIDCVVLTEELADLGDMALFLNNMLDKQGALWYYMRKQHGLFGLSAML